jgi:toxin ParE1/3/4
VTCKVSFLPTALEDRRSIFVYVAEAADFETADKYDRRIEGACLRLGNFPGRGTPRDDLAPGLRTLSFERRAVIAYKVQAGDVQIVRILYGGRDLRSAFA